MISISVAKELIFDFRVSSTIECSCWFLELLSSSFDKSKSEDSEFPLAIDPANASVWITLPSLETKSSGVAPNIVFPSMGSKRK